MAQPMAMVSPRVPYMQARSQYLDWGAPWLELIGNKSEGNRVDHKSYNDRS